MRFFEGLELTFACSFKLDKVRFCPIRYVCWSCFAENNIILYVGSTGGA